MLYRFIFLFLFSAFSMEGPAQLPDGSVAPDWTLTDVTGAEHTLYDYLNDGKTVFIHFASTWCGPCWSYHISGAFDQLFEQNGPNGTDEVMVFTIESDWNTGIDDLSGTGSYTYGDWLGNSTHPIIDDHSLIDAYAVNSWPTIYKICTNKRIEKIGHWDYQTLLQCIQSCDGSVGNHNVSILSYQGFEGPFCQSVSFVPRLVLQNEGAQILSRCQIDLLIDGAMASTGLWVGAAEPLQSFTFDFDTLRLQAPGTLNFRVWAPNDEPDDMPQDNLLDNIEVDAPVSTTTLRMYWHTDLWPEENKWWLRQADGIVLYSSGNILLDPDKEYQFSFELESDQCYEFEMIDTFGDGLINGSVGPGQYVEGAIRLESDAGVIWDDPQFGFGFLLPFEVDEHATLTEEDFPQSAFHLFPNPATHWLQLGVHSLRAQKAQIVVYDILGQPVLILPDQQLAAGKQQFELSLSTLKAGLYYISLHLESQEFVKSFVVHP